MLKILRNVCWDFVPIDIYFLFYYIRHYDLIRYQAFTTLLLQGHYNLYCIL